MSGIIPRVALRAPTTRALARQNLSRRFISTTPPAHRSRSFKSSLARWTLAIGGVWYLSSSDILAEGSLYPQQLPETRQEDENLPTVDSLAAARRERQGAAANSTPERASAASPEAASKVQTSVAGDAEQLEEEAEGEGAFNPETGEINWDCPCLGGMAHGPCGPEFREAFSCFVYSSGEPKGIECIDRFKSMQDCFRAHPDVYGAELTDDPTDEELEENARAAGEQAQGKTAAAPEVAPAPYSGAESPQDKVPGANLTSTPSASPSSVSSSTEISSKARSANEATGRKE